MGNLNERSCRHYRLRSVGAGGVTGVAPYIAQLQVGNLLNASQDEWTPERAAEQHENRMDLYLPLRGITAIHTKFKVFPHFLFRC